VDEHYVSIFFTTTCFTAPVAGVIIGGVITTAFGGYNTIKSFKLLRLIGLCAVACALPIPFFSSFLVVGWLIWLLLFFGGFILPSLTGIMISSVGEYQKSQANSVANICYTMLGYLPAPFVYGMISVFMNDPQSRVPMACILYSTLLTVSLALYGLNKRIELSKMEI